MKKRISMILLFLLLFQLAACSSGKNGDANRLTKEGVAPYELTEQESYLLQSFGLGDGAKAISFLAPEQAVSMEVNVYFLGEDQQWEKRDGGSISLGTAVADAEQTSGIFTVKANPDHSLDIRVNGAGSMSFSTAPVPMEREDEVTAAAFLKEFQQIELGREIPVAIMVYDSGTEMSSFSAQDYFEQSKFEGMDLVQAVTLTFSAKGS